MHVRGTMTSKRCGHRHKATRGAVETCADCGAWRSTAATSRRKRWQSAPAPGVVYAWAVEDIYAGSMVTIDDAGSVRCAVTPTPRLA